MNIIVGKYDNVVELFAPIITTNSSSGEVAQSYSETTTATLFCFINNRANNEVFNDLQRQSNTTITIDCRYNDIDALNVGLNWIMIIENQTFQVNSISEATEYSRRTVTRISGIERV